MLHLAPGQIDLWACRHDDTCDEVVVARCRALLSPLERHQEQRFRFHRDRRRYVMTRALLRTTLSRYASIKPTQWTFVANRYGKPGISNQYDAACDLTFNLSHTDGLIFLALTDGGAIGVDVENVRSHPPSLDIAHCFFADDEVNALVPLTELERQQRFFDFWTLKEAYIKARGMGLSLDLKKFSFCFPPPAGIDISFHPSLGDRSSNWYFRQFRPSPEHLVAICSERSQALKPIEIVVRTAVPLHSEEVVSFPVLRESI
jgi:4'-phosphopantetheinyl transferase